MAVRLSDAAADDEAKNIQISGIILGDCSGPDSKASEKTKG